MDWKNTTNFSRVLFFLLLVPFCSFAQTVTVSGYIKDAVTKEGLYGANIFSLDTKKGVTSKSEGYFSFSVQQGDTLRLRFSFIGYTAQYNQFVCKTDTALLIKLVPNEQELRQVVVAANTVENQYAEGIMNMTYLSATDIQNTPTFLAEPDVIKVLQLKPGVQSGGEGQNGFFVRGGQADQNLVLFDGVSIYNPSHLGGMFSIFNNSALKNVKLYKGGFPAQFGGRISSVMDINSKNGNLHEFKASGGVGLISSRLTLEAPLKKEKASVLIGARRTYFDLITEKVNESNAHKANFSPIPIYHFYDLNTKIYTKLGKKDELSFTGYVGRDLFKFQDDNFQLNFLWGNKLGAINWKHKYNDKFFHNIRVGITDYKYRIRNHFNSFVHTVGSGIQDIVLNSDFDYRIHQKHNLYFGMQLTHHAFDVLRKQEEDKNSPLKLKSNGTDNVTVLEGAVYIADRFEPTDNLILEGGVRASSFSSKNNFYLNLEPRISTNYSISKKTTLKASYSLANQYVHLVSSSGSSLPTNFWYPSTDEIMPQKAEQFASGVTFFFKGGDIILSNELYYRKMKNQIDFRDGAELFGSPEVTNDLVFGKGWAYGNEFYLEKRNGNTTGWIGYTLSWTYRQFDEINKGQKFPSTQDRRHDISIVLQQKLSNRWTFSSSWVYGSGGVATLPAARVFVQDQQSSNPNIIPLYTARNTFRLASYHRLDVGFVYKLQPKWGEADLTIGIYNIYNRRNPYFVYFERDLAHRDRPPTFIARQVSLFPILPAISFNYKF